MTRNCQDDEYPIIESNTMPHSDAIEEQSTWDNDMIGNEEVNESNDIHVETTPSENDKLEVHESVMDEEQIDSDETTPDCTTNKRSNRQTTHTRSG